MIEMPLILNLIVQVVAEQVKIVIIIQTCFSPMKTISSNKRIVKKIIVKLTILVVDLEELFLQYQTIQIKKKMLAVLSTIPIIKFILHHLKQLQCAKSLMQKLI